MIARDLGSLFAGDMGEAVRGFMFELPFEVEVPEWLAWPCVMIWVLARSLCEGMTAFAVSSFTCLVLVPAVTAWGVVEQGGAGWMMCTAAWGLVAG
jgi:hypothetical protein